MASKKPNPKQPKGGFFISFEGGEGSGKSTQAAMLGEQLRLEGYDVLETREPGGSPAGMIVREVLLGGHAAEKGPLAEACLLTSARREHVDLVIRPALAKDQVVICDRFADSTRIYQGYVGGLLSQTIDQLEAVATDGLMPEVTFVLDVSADVAMSRRKARLSSKGDADDRFEKEDQSFHDKVAKGFRWLCDTYPQRCLLIDGSGKPNAVAVTIRDSLRLRGLI
jgi:dTMP kinase